MANTAIGVLVRESKDPQQRRSFRSSWTIPEGMTGAIIIEGRIIDTNLTTWTVDFAAQFDQKYFLNVQVSSPYMNPVQSEGIYAFPDIGSKCVLCLPSDGCPPFILSFIMPMERGGERIWDDAQQKEINAGSNFAGGRVKAKPGDICVKGRDGNFCVLHRGGVLQIGSTQLAQRIFIPLNNIVTDISQNYHHYNTGGAINWSVGNIEEDNPGTLYRQTFRLHANEEKASVRVSMGTFRDVVGEHSDGLDNQADLDAMGIGSEPLVCEVAFSPEQFGGDDGSVSADTPKTALLRFLFDEEGGAYLGTKGSLLLSTKGKLRLKAKGDIELNTEGNVTFQSGGLFRIEGGALTEIQGGVVKIGPGTRQAAHVGSTVEVFLTPGMPLVVPQSGNALPAIKLTGTVTRGRGNVLL